MSRLIELKQHLQPGHVYRRADLEPWSNATDRHLKQLQAEGTLVKLSAGLYYCPKETAFGQVPADDTVLIQAFLKDTRFLVMTPNAYNMLGIGTTQLYNETVVYNHKRHGLFLLGGRPFDFRMKPYFPTVLTPEFLLVDVVNNVNRLAENQKDVLTRIRKKALEMDTEPLSNAIRAYGNIGTRKFFSNVFKNPGLRHVV